MIDKTIELNK